MRDYMLMVIILILETLEDSFKYHEQVDSTKLSIEYIMPQTLTDW